MAVGLIHIPEREFWAMPMRSWLNALDGWQAQFGEGAPEAPTREEIEAAFDDPEMRARLGIMH